MYAQAATTQSQAAKGVGLLHLLSQSPVLGPSAEVAAQEAQCSLVLCCLLLYTLDLECPTLFYRRWREHDYQTVG